MLIIESFPFCMILNIRGGFLQFICKENVACYANTPKSTSKKMQEQLCCHITVKYYDFNIFSKTNRSNSNNSYRMALCVFFNMKKRKTNLFITTNQTEVVQRNQRDETVAVIFSKKYVLGCSTLLSDVPKVENFICSSHDPLIWFIRFPK